MKPLDRLRKGIAFLLRQPVAAGMPTPTAPHPAAHLVPTVPGMSATDADAAASGDLDTLFMEYHRQSESGELAQVSPSRGRTTVQSLFAMLEAGEPLPNALPSNLMGAFQDWRKGKGIAPKPSATRPATRATPQRPSPTVPASKPSPTPALTASQTNELMQILEMAVAASKPATATKHAPPPAKPVDARAVGILRMVGNSGGTSKSDLSMVTKILQEKRVQHTAQEVVRDFRIAKSVTPDQPVKEQAYRLKILEKYVNCLPEFISALAPAK
jgi:hypothetical protein